jgi:hypothetical protein
MANSFIGSVVDDGGRISPLLQKCWVWFMMDTSKRHLVEAAPELGIGEKRERCLCERRRDHLTIITGSGAVNYVPLPFTVRSMICLSTGLLIERSTEGEGRTSLPTLFSLLHPTNDLCPVAMKRSTQGGHGVVILLSWSAERAHHPSALFRLPEHFIRWVCD